MKRKKLIEVALPLDVINKAAKREKSIRHGHPSTLHLWWARRPLAAARAVIFAQMVDDPSSRPELFPTQAEQDAERARLFDLIDKLVQWKNTTNETILDDARTEIKESWRRTCGDLASETQTKEAFDPDRLPAFHDPFAGGGTLPLEAQRLGLEPYASDLNPVAVLINKAMIDIPARFAGMPPIHPDWRKGEGEKRKLTTWQMAQGLAEDVRLYGRWMRDEAAKRIGNFYPCVYVTAEACEGRPDLKKYKGEELGVIAWLWARTVPSPNPAFSDVQVPLTSSFWLSRKAGRKTWVEPVLDGRRWRFEVHVGEPGDSARVGAGTKTGRAQFACVVSGAPITSEWIQEMGMAGQMGHRLMAIVAEGDRSRVYLNGVTAHETAAATMESRWSPEGDVPKRLTGGTCYGYGLTKWHHLFTSRQLVALTTFSDLVDEARAKVRRDALQSGMPEGAPLRDGGVGAAAYSEAVAVYLGLTVGRQANRTSTLSIWDSGRQNIQQAFGRQALPMTWDYCECNPFSNATGNWIGQIAFPAKVVERVPALRRGTVAQEDAQRQSMSVAKIVSTDPPYYDNIGYADLSDFFYIWLRRTLKPTFPDLFATMSVPKDDELVATRYRHGGKERAEKYFMDGMVRAMRRLADQAHPAFPVTIYYAFKQSEKRGGGGRASTGWETFLQAIVDVGFQITGTWPIRTELTGNLKKNVAALASSIVLVCRRRADNAEVVARSEFRKALIAELPKALRPLQAANIAPVDLAQAAIGPGMAIYSRCRKVVCPDGSAVSVRTALEYINEALDSALGGDFDSETLWALAWFESHRFDEGEFGVAEVLAKAKNTSVATLADSGLLESRSGVVRLLEPGEMQARSDPSDLERASAWKKTHLVANAYREDGELGAAEMLESMDVGGDVVRDLAYRCYVICERKRWAETAFAYNALVSSWPEIVLQSRLKPWLRESEPELGLKGDG